MPEMHLRQPGLTYSACGSFTKKKERVEKFERTGDSRYIYQNQLDNAYNKTQLTCISRISLEEQLWMKYYLIEHLILLKTQNVMHIKEIFIGLYIF